MTAVLQPAGRGACLAEASSRTPAVIPVSPGANCPGDSRSLLSVPSAGNIPKKNPSINPAPSEADELVDALHQLELQAERPESLADHSPNLFLKAAMNIAAMDFFTVLNRFDTVNLAKRLEAKPELYFQVLNSHANLMRANLEHQKFEFRKQQSQAKQRERDRKLRARKPILITQTVLDAFARTWDRCREQADCTHAARRSSSCNEQTACGLATPDPASGIHDQHSPASTANTGVTDTLSVAASDYCQPTTDLRPLNVQNPDAEPSCEPARMDVPSEHLICSPA